jgi:hypothetical protein
MGLCEQEFRLAQVKDALTTAEIEYEEIELSGQLKLLESIKRTTGRSTVPQVRVWFTTMMQYLG